jgi:gas vesicle protein
LLARIKNIPNCMIRITQLVTITLFLWSCSSPTKRFLTGAGVGAAVGGMGGYSMSPNEDSDAMNAAVFGLTGALVGGATGLLWRDDATVPDGDKEKTLEEKERARNSPDNAGSSVGGSKEFGLPSSQLPDFLQGRYAPARIEEFTEREQVGEDGSLHAPHKVYRIKRPATLYTNPTQPKKSNKGDKK